MFNSTLRHTISLWVFVFFLKILAQCRDTNGYKDETKVSSEGTFVARKIDKIRTIYYNYDVVLNLRSATSRGYRTTAGKKSNSII